MTLAQVAALKAKADPKNRPLEIQEKAQVYLLALESIENVLVPEQFKNKVAQSG
jgi:hypothetical protein